MANSGTTVQGLLTALRASLQSATDVLPSEDSILPPTDGISLLDVKNELLLSYLQNLVFLILFKIRQHVSSASDAAEEGQGVRNDDVVTQLVELRVQLEKGVRPLESRLKYQIDKVIRAFDDSVRDRAQNPPANNKAKPKPNKKRTDDDDSDDSDRASDAASDSDPASEIDELSYRPNPSAFKRPSTSTKRPANATPSGAYKPPRIAATAMPNPDPRREQRDRRPTKSAVLDDFVATELSAAPRAEPSIGSNIVAGGRRSTTERERRVEAERRDYEEANLVRLPAESRKDRAKKAGRRGDGFGGEEWTSIDAGLDRIERLTRRKGGKLGKLASSRKRVIEDGPRGDGVQAGERFAKRRMMDTPKRKRRRG